MSETEKLIVGVLATVLLLFVPGFVLHEAPRFPGSLPGGMLGVAGAGLMLLLLIYPLVKHLRWARDRVTRLVPMRVVLSFHIYAGVLGALLGILHTGHKYTSPLGITLVASMLAVVLSGFVGRYYMAHLVAEAREQKTVLDTLRAEYDRIAEQRAGAPMPRGPVFSLGRWLGVPAPNGAGPELGAHKSAVSVMKLVSAIADLEYAMRAREAIEQAFRRWMVVHIGAAIIMYAALVLHVWNGIYYGLRWL